MKNLFNFQKGHSMMNLNLNKEELRQGKGLVFGRTLDELMERQKDKYPDLLIPIFVWDALDILYENGGVNEPGLFRLSATFTVLEQIKRAVDSGKLIKGFLIQILSILLQVPSWFIHHLNVIYMLLLV